MRFIGRLLSTVFLLLGGCSSSSDDAYLRLLHLAGIRNTSELRRVEFIKTSGIDPYYLAKIEVTAKAPFDVRNISESADWKIIDYRVITPPSEIHWWRPEELQDLRIWTPKGRDVPSYTEVASGVLGDRVVIYVAWMSHLSY